MKTYLDGVDTSNDTSLSPGDRCYLSLLNGNKFKISDIYNFHASVYPGNFARDCNYVMSFDLSNAQFNLENGAAIVPSRYLSNSESAADVTSVMRNNGLGVYPILAHRRAYEADVAIVPGNLNAEVLKIAKWVAKNDVLFSFIDQLADKLPFYITVQRGGKHDVEYSSKSPLPNLSRDARFEKVFKYLEFLDSSRFGFSSYLEVSSTYGNFVDVKRQYRLIPQMYTDKDFISRMRKQAKLLNY